MSSVFIGRRESVGIGLEATAGTAVAPQTWARHLSLALNQKTTQAQNMSAMGRIEDINDSAVTEEWAEGSLNGKVTDISIGYILANVFNTPVPTLHSGQTAVWDNAFNTSSTSTAPNLTFTRVNPNVTRRYALGAFTDFELDVKAGGWAEFTASMLAKVGVTGSDVAAYNNTENEFTSKHTVVKLASNVAGLGAASALQVKSLKLKVTQKIDRFTPLGALDPAAFDDQAWGVTGELVLRYGDTTLEALALANTRQALSISLTNTDVTIGTGSVSPSLTFTAPKVRLAPISLDTNLDQVLNQTIVFSCELDTTAGYMLQAVLTNVQNGYVHA